MVVVAGAWVPPGLVSGPSTFVVVVEEAGVSP